MKTMLFVILTAAITNIPAVSVLRIRFPSVTGLTPEFIAISTSPSENPPSGPIKMDSFCPGFKLPISSLVSAIPPAPGRLSESS